MKISYFLYSLLVAFWIYTDAPLHGRSRWWSLFTFLLPLLTPYYFIKTRPSNKYWKYIGIWIAGFALFHTIETVFLKTDQLAIKSNSTVSYPASELKSQIKSRSHKSGTSAQNFQKALNHLDKITELDTIPKINEAIAIIERVQLLFYQANQDSDDLSDFIGQNKIQLQKEGLDVFLDMEGLRSETYFTHRKALREYLNTYKAMLEYLRDNFEAIIKGKEPQIGTYNQLYLKYRNALDVHNEAYLQHMKFVDQYSREHPALVEFITEARQGLRKE